MNRRTNRVFALVCALLCALAARAQSEPSSERPAPLFADEVKSAHRMSLHEHLAAAWARVANPAPDDEVAADIRRTIEDVAAAIAPHFGPDGLAAPGGSGEPRPSATSRLSLVTHLRCARDEARQVFGQWNSGRGGSAAGLAAIDAAIHTLDGALRAAIERRGWSRHCSDQGTASVEAPAEFRLRRSAKGWLIHLEHLGADSATEQLVYVTRSPPWSDYPRRRLAERRDAATRGFESVEIIDEGTAHGFAQDGYFEFTYAYDWQGNRIRALVRGVTRADGVYEIHCVAREQSFDRDLFDQIYESLVVARAGQAGIGATVSDDAEHSEPK